MHYYCLKYHEVCNLQKCGKCPSLDAEGHCDWSMDHDQYEKERPDLSIYDQIQTIFHKARDLH